MRRTLGRAAPIGPVIGVDLTKRRRGQPSVDVINVAGIEDLDFPPNCDGRSSHIRDHQFDDHRVVIGVDEHRDTAGPRKKVAQQPEPLLKLSRR